MASCTGICAPSIKLVKNISSVMALVMGARYGSKLSSCLIASSQSLSLADIIFSVTAYQYGFPAALYRESTEAPAFRRFTSSGQKLSMDRLSGSLKSTSCRDR